MILGRIEGMIVFDVFIHVFIYLHSKDVRDPETAVPQVIEGLIRLRYRGKPAQTASLSRHLCTSM